jgi:predicted permease
MFIRRILHLVVPIIAGNILCALVFFAFVFNAPSLWDSNWVVILLLYFILVVFVFFSMGVLAAISHKQNASTFSITQSIVDGLLSGFLSSLVFAVFVASEFAGWVAVAIPFVAGIVGAIGGLAGGIEYKFFFAKRIS